MKVYNILKNLINKINESVSVEPSTTTPLIDGTAAVGIESKYARGDHVHPRNASSFYGTSSTSAGTAAKVVTATGFTFDAGNILCVNFSTGNTANTPTLNVNSAGAKSIYIGGSTPSGTANVLKWSAKTLVYFMYDGTYFRYITSVSAGSVLSSRGAGTWYGTCSTAETTTAKTSAITNFVLTTGAIAVIKFTYAVPASVTLNINSTGAKNIYYQGAAITAGIINAGDVATFVYDGTQYALASVDHRRITEAEIDEMFGIASGTGSNAQDYVIGYGTSGEWSYRLWNSGISECWFAKTETINCTTSWGSIYETSALYYSYPQVPISDVGTTDIFVSSPQININMYGTFSFMTEVGTGGSATRTPYFYGVRGTAASNVSAVINIKAVGRWK